jgi:catechol 2,3-dioxygenase-like lactoylglutathione lyase family enzyme
VWQEQLREQGVVIEKEFSFDEGLVPNYFRDPDGNLLELAVSSIWALRT